MSETTETTGLWMRHDGPGPARERLRKTVAALTRARRLQLLVDHAFAGLLAGLCIATVTVLVVRQAGWVYPAWRIAAAAIAVATCAALAVGWWRRPGALEVAIRADLMLRLKQRLSTAWEFMTVPGNDALADRLAVQAIRAGVPAHAGTVFPLRVNRCGWLAPLAATALVLVSVADLRVVQAPAQSKADARVVSEGQRLGAFGRAMQARAEREKLPRSTRQAGALERLGARMESGALDRDQALGQMGALSQAIAQERDQALADVDRTHRGMGAAEGRHGSPVAPAIDPAAMLDRLQRGALDGADARALGQRLDDLERAGIARKDVQNALQRHQAGDDDALREILTKLAKLDRALKEDKELSNALEQLRRAQDNLGTPRATAENPGSSPAPIDWDDDEREGRDASGATRSRSEPRLDGPSTGRASRAAAQGDASTATERADSPLRTDTGPAGRVLRPAGQPRAGEDFSSQGRMLPRSNRPGLERMDMPSEYAAQVESVLAREFYPEHRKDYVRRYFLNLSQGARNSREPPVAQGEQRE